jgi:hypothetical protein
MNIEKYYKISAKAENWGLKTFYAVTCISALLIAFSKPELEVWLHPVIVVAAFVAIGCTIITTIYQTQGNQLLRSAQLSDALGATVSDRAREGYYNSPLSPSIQRLATTTLENTLFTGGVLSKMLVKERRKIAIYSSVLLLLLTFRQTSTGCLLLLAQTLFSADLLIAWLRMERFRFRTNRVHESLRQFFLQDGNVENPNGMAIVLVAFTDYECAKDEAAIPLDGAVFEKLNPLLSERWDKMKQQLNITYCPTTPPSSPSTAATGSSKAFRWRSLPTM